MNDESTTTSSAHCCNRCGMHMTNNYTLINGMPTCDFCVADLTKKYINTENYPIQAGNSHLLATKQTTSKVELLIDPIKRQIDALPKLDREFLLAYYIQPPKQVTDEEIMSVIRQYPHSLVDNKKSYFESIIVAIVRDLVIQPKREVTDEEIRIIFNKHCEKWKGGYPTPIMLVDGFIEAVHDLLQGKEEQK